MTRLKSLRFHGLPARRCASACLGALCLLLWLAACSAQDPALQPGAQTPAENLTPPAPGAPLLPPFSTGGELQTITRSASQYILSSADLQSGFGAAFDGEYLTLGDPLLPSYAVFAAYLAPDAPLPSMLQLSGEAGGLWLARADWQRPAWQLEGSALSFSSTASLPLAPEGLLSAQRELRLALFCPAGSSARVKLDLNLSSAPQTPWNLLLWMAADNNLSPYGVLDLNELESVGSTPGVRILAGYDIPYDWEPGTTGIEQVNFIRLAADANPAAVKADADPANISFERSGYDCGDPRHLREFVQWASDNFPAQRTALVLWGHGTGWRPERDAPPADKGGSSVSGGPAARRGGSGVLIDYTDGIGGHSSNGWIASELSGFHFDLLLFDSCFMGDLESLFEYRELADYMIASELVVPIWGFPYDAVLQNWTSSPGILDPPAVGRIFIDEFTAEYEDREICHALVDSAALSELGGELQFLGLSLQFAPKPEWDIFRAAVNEQPLPGELQDIGAFLADYIPATSDQTLRSQAQQCLSAYEESIVYFASENAPGRSGLSMFLPGPGYTSSYAAMYRPMAFNQYTQWLESLEAVGFE
ncbi:hypothetical protein IT575_13715 [bacterium]|nr:hypothetical protein [bacterium]